MDEIEAHLKSLMLRGLGGDAHATRELMTLLSARLRVYFLKRMATGSADLEDLVQETLIAVHTRRASYDRAQPFTAWAHAIARYKLIDHWRRQRIRMTVPLEDIVEFLSAEPVATDDALDIHRALQTLSPRQQTLVDDVKIQGFSLAEAGARAGISEGAAKVALHRALRLLAKRMDRADG